MKTIKMINSDKFINRQFLVMVLLLSLFFPFTAVYAAVDFNAMLGALSKNAVPLIRLVVAVAYVMGVWFIFSAIIALKAIGQSQSQTQGGLSGPIMKFIIGLMLLYLPSVVDIGVWTLWQHTAFGPEAASRMSYSPDASDPFSLTKQGSILIVRLVGYISFVKGFVILSRSTEQGAQQGSVGKGIIHIIGGILAINIVETIKMISETLGFTTI